MCCLSEPNFRDRPAASLEMYSSGRKRSHSKCDRSARARGFDSHHLRLQRKQIQAAGKWIHFPAVCVILSAPSCGEGNRPRSPGRLKACGLSLCGCRHIFIRKKSTTEIRKRPSGADFFG